MCVYVCVSLCLCDCCARVTVWPYVKLATNIVKCLLDMLSGVVVIGAFASICVRACVRACVCVCVRARARVCVCVRAFLCVKDLEPSSAALGSMWA